MSNKKIILAGKLALAASTAFVTVASPLNTIAIYAEETSTKLELGTQIVSASAKSLGPATDGDTVEASFDGNFKTYTNSNYNNPSVSKPQEYYLTLDKSYNVDKVRIAPRETEYGVGNGAPTSCEVFVSADGGKTYTSVANKTDINPSIVQFTDITFAPVEANAIKLVMNSNHEKVVSTGEVEVYGTEIVKEHEISGTNLAHGKTVTASAESSTMPKGHAVDGDLTTRWSTETNKTPEWLCVDLGTSQYVDSFEMHWESDTEYAANYEIYVTDDTNNRGTAVVTRNGNTSGLSSDVLSTPVKGRYVILNVTKVSNYPNVSLNEFEVFMNGVIPNEDKLALSEKITVAESTLNDSKYSYEYKVRKDALSQGIQDAKEVVSKEGVTSEECKNATTTLESAIQAFLTRDTTELQANVEKWETFTSEHSFFKKYQTKLEDARKTIGEPTSTTQKIIDQKAANVDAFGYLIKVQELNSKYANFVKTPYDYTQHKADSIKDVLYMSALTDDISSNYEEVITEEGEVAPDNRNHPGQMKGWYERYSKAVETMEQSIASPTDKYVGVPNSILKEVVDSTDKQQGNFKVVDEKQENGKHVVTVQFINDGLHPIFGEKLPNAVSATEYKRYSGDILNGNFTYVPYTTLDKNGDSVSVKNIEKIEVDGKTAIQGTIEVDADVNYITLEFDYKGEDTHSPWAYKISEEVVDTSHVYVGASGNDETGKGTETSPFATIDKALEVVDEGGTITLLSDLELPKTTQAIKKDVTIDGNGHTITRKVVNATTNIFTISSADVNFENVSIKAEGLCKNIIEVTSKSNVKLSNGTVLSGKGKEALVTTSSGTLVIEDATLSKGDKMGVVVKNGATVTMNDGIITSNNTSGISCQDGSEFIMNGGTIIDNKQAGVVQSGGASIQLNDGTISGNKSAQLSFSAGAKGVDSLVDIPSGMIQGDTSLKFTTTVLTLDENYADFGATILSEDAFKSLKDKTEAQGEDDWKASQSYGYLIKPSTEQFHFMLKTPSELKDESVYAAFIELDENGMVVDNAELQVSPVVKGGSLDVTMDNLKPNTMYGMIITYGVEPDIVSPEVKVSYSSTEPTNESVTVTLTSNEAIETPEGWTKVDDKTFTKTYSENKTEEVTVTDLVGNPSTVKVSVTNIDKTAPVITKTTYKQDEKTKYMTVTVEVSEAAKDVEGWTKVNEEGTILTKTYKESAKEELVVEDLAGNKSKPEQIVVTIKTESETEKPTDPDKDKPSKEEGNDTGVGLSGGLFAGLAGTSLAGLGILELFKRRKK